MKVLLFSDIGNFIPSVIAKQMKGETFEECRTGEIIDFIERTAEIPDFENCGFPALKSYFDVFGEDKIFLISVDDAKKEKLFAATAPLMYGTTVVTFTIKDIDTNKEWLLSEYDGAEMLKCHDSIECVSRKLNIWKEK